MAPEPPASGVPIRGLRLWTRCVVVATAAALATHGTADAQETPRASVRLDYARTADTEGCPEAADVKASVVARLGYDPFVTESSTTVRARIRRRGRTLTAAVDLVRDGTAVGSRTLESRKSDCDELAQAMSLAITLAIDPQAALAAEPSLSGDAGRDPKAPSAAPPGSDPAAGAGAPQQPTQPPSATPAPPPVTPQRTVAGRPSARLRHVPVARRWEPFVGAGVGVGAGVVPAWTPSVALHVGAAREPVRAALEWRWFASQSTDGERAWVSASLLEIALVPCWRPTRVGWLELCALGTLGALRGDGHDITSPRSDTTLYASAGGRAGVPLRLFGPLETSIYGELAAVLTPTDLEISRRAVWEGSNVRATLGLQLAVDVR